MANKAKESPQILKARQKIERQLADTTKQINPDALQNMSLIIKRQLARHKNERIDLKSRNIMPSAAKPENKFVRRLLKQLKQQSIKPQENDNQLEGRVKNIHEQT